jgi:hypothetical protein
MFNYNTLLISAHPPKEIELIRNGDFSQGTLYWSLSPPEYFSVGPTDIHALVGPFIGSQIKGDNALLFEVEKPGWYNGSISQTFLISSSAKVTLSFTVIASSLLSSPSLRVLVLSDGKYYDVSGTLSLKSCPSTEAYDKTYEGFVKIYELAYDLTNYAGQKVTLMILFSFKTDYYAGKIYFDDISVRVQADFSITAPPNLTIQKDSSANLTVTVISLGVFDESIKLTVSGVPLGVIATLKPETVMLSSNGSATSTLIISVDATAKPGNYTLTITGAVGDITHNASILLRITPLHKLLLDVSPKIGEIIINGYKHSASELPFITYVRINEQISISIAPFLNFINNTRYRFAGWNDGNNSTARIVRVSSDMSLTAMFVKQFYLDMVVDPQDAGSVFPESGWYDAGSRIEISATPFMDYFFYKWEGVGKGSYSGNISSAVITMNEPISQKALFRIPIEVSSPYGAPSGGGWYHKGEAVKIYVSPTSIDHRNGTRHVFSGWYDNTHLLSSDSQTSLIVEKASRIVAAWNTQYLLSASSLYGDVSGGGWYNNGSTATLSVSPAHGESLFTGYMSAFVFNHWEEDEKAVSTSQTCSIIVEKPISLKAVYIKEVNLPAFAGTIVLIILFFTMAKLTKRNSIRGTFIIASFTVMLIDGIVLTEPFRKEFLPISFKMDINPLSSGVFILNAIIAAAMSMHVAVEHVRKMIEQRRTKERRRMLEDLDEMIKKVEGFMEELKRSKREEEKAEKGKKKGKRRKVN